MLNTLLLLFAGAAGLITCGLAVLDRFSPIGRTLERHQWYGLMATGLGGVIVTGVVQYFLSREGEAASTGAEVGFAITSGLSFLLGAVGMAAAIVCAAFTVVYIRHVLIMRQLGGKNTYSRKKRIDIVAKAWMYPMLTLCLAAITALNAHSLSG